jgi:hypothetical protein
VGLVGEAERGRHLAGALAREEALARGGPSAAPSTVGRDVAGPVELAHAP